MNPLLFSTLFSCAYSFYGGPFATIEYRESAEGKFESQVKILQIGRSHVESFETIPADQGQYMHGFIQRGTSNEIEVFIYQPVNEVWNSKIINRQIPAGQEMTGICEKSSY